MVTVVTRYTQGAIMNYVADNFDKNIWDVYFPENGIHPRDTCRIVDESIILNSYKDIVIETLAECVVNRIGYLIYKGVIKEAICIWLDEEHVPHKCKYNSKGFIENWKLGFFSPEKL